MKITYIGPKTKITLSMPFGARTRQEITGHIPFLKGETQEVPDKDAAKILDFDPNFISEGSKVPKIKKTRKPKKYAAVVSEEKKDEEIQEFMREYGSK